MSLFDGTKRDENKIHYPPFTIYDILSTSYKILYTPLNMIPQQQLIKTIEKAVPAVVSVSAQEKISDAEKKSPEMLFPLFERDTKKTKHLIKKMSGENLHVSGGSGCIIDKSGIVITNMHVILENHLSYVITMSDETECPAKLITTDVVGDVAFLKIISDKKTFPHLLLGDSSQVKLGQYVVAIGNALGMFNNTVSFGIISGLSRSIEARRGKLKEQLHGLLQTDAAINPGNSGGPLVDMNGKVIGINAASVFSAENIGFAIPINTIKRDIESIKKYGEIHRPFLGVRYVVLDPHVAKAFSSPLHEGMMVISPYLRHPAILPNSPAQKAGIKERDVLIAIDGKMLTPSFTLQDALDTYAPGDTIAVRIMRGGREHTLRVTLKSR